MNGTVVGWRVTAAGTLLAMLAALLASAAGPAPASASCATLMSFEEAARRPGAAVFTGRAVREDAEYRVVFAVDRWFAGSHPARVVLFGDALAGLAEKPEAGAISAVLARTVSGEGIGFVRDEPVIIAAMRRTDGEYDPVICTDAPLALASPEGQAALATATALFGPGITASGLPATATLPHAAPGTPVAPWFLLIALAAGLVGMLVVLGRRDAIVRG